MHGGVERERMLDERDGERMTGLLMNPMHGRLGRYWHGGYMAGIGIIEIPVCLSMT